MLKYVTAFLVVISLLSVSCTRNDEGILENKAKELNRNIDNIEPGCRKLAKCLGAVGTIIHFAHQNHSPIACEVRIGQDVIWLYPDSNLGFGEFGSTPYDNALKICDLIHHSGEFSKEYKEEIRKISKDMERQRKLRQERKLKEIEEQENERKSRLPIKEFK